ncbi:WD40 repeat-like protein [Trichodelitschia bisporula]|uniref:WD40 repeat-like protein n=1 Tax=Trichodelitschia bisporula TaxID=703511 RepID=A0A6G1HMN1_9PEZI|nr:WD40 repeat-like protein [Trichodelitschia bisporula]
MSKKRKADSDLPSSQDFHLSRTYDDAGGVAFSDLIEKDRTPLNDDDGVLLPLVGPQTAVELQTPVTSDPDARDPKRRRLDGALSPLQQRASSDVILTGFSPSPVPVMRSELLRSNTDNHGTNATPNGSPWNSQAPEWNAPASGMSPLSANTPDGLPALSRLRKRNHLISYHPKASMRQFNPDRLKKFKASTLPPAGGAHFTFEEQIMIGFLHEVMGVSWTGIDAIMGRGINCCATKFLRRPKGFNVSEVRRQIHYDRHIETIKSILVKDMSIAEVMDAFCHRLQEGKPPSDVGRRWAKASPVAKTGTPNIEAPSMETPGIETPNMVTPTIEAPNVETPNDIKVPRAAPVSRILRPRLERGTSASASASAPDTPSASSQLPSPDADVSSSEHTGRHALRSRHSLRLKNNTYADGMVPTQLKPYLDFFTRKTLKEGLSSIDWSDDPEAWKGTELHVPFDPDEAEELLACVQARLHQRKRAVPQSNASPVRQIISLVQDATTAELSDFAWRAKNGGKLNDRSYASIEGFLKDAARKRPQTSETAPPIQLARGGVPKTKAPLTTRLLQREISSAGPEPGSARTVAAQLKEMVHDAMNPVLNFTGASGDVGTVAWSPDGLQFAAGSVCLVDPSSMQYNRPNNLLLGDIPRKAIRELPEHSRPRPRTETGPNSTRAMQATQDPRLFETVSSVSFKADGSCFYSTGYDNALRVYDVSEGTKNCKMTWSYDHGAKVDLLGVSRVNGLIATGCHQTENSIRIFHHGSDGIELDSQFTSRLATKYPNKKSHPSCLRWGPHSLTSNLLLAGYATQVNDDVKETYGEICMWDVETGRPLTMSPSTGNIFDCAWSPSNRLLATASSAVSIKVNRGTRSVVKVYWPTESRWSSHGVELECTALDINDVVFCPQEQHYVAAGATDGKVYVWDIRRPDYLLHKFSHGEPLVEPDPNFAREVLDTGVCFCAWGDSRSRLHTASSDGILKAWDIFRSPQDAHITNIASFNSGIMSGAFSSDFSSLLIGEVNGSVSVLEAGAPSIKGRAVRPFRFEPAPTEPPPFLPTTPAERPTTPVDSLPTTDDESAPQGSTTPKHSPSGRALGEHLVATKQIAIRSFGPKRQAVRGRKYTGPWDRGADAGSLRAKAVVFQHGIRARRARTPCHIPLCRASVPHFTDEEGDSGRWADRIPGALRDAVAAAARHEGKGEMVPGMLSCAHCSAPARPRTGDEEQEVFPLSHSSGSCRIYG